jgi:hypothetical protein
MDASVRNHALRLRMQGRSYSEIRKEIKVAKSTLSLWLKNIVISDSAKMRLKNREREGSVRGLIKRNKRQTHLAIQRARVAQETGMHAIQASIQKSDLCVIGAVLYWAEGYKRLVIRDGRERTGHAISFVNADPQMVRTFVSFLTHSLQIPKERIRLIMRLYPHINEEKAKRFWSRVTALPSSAFNKSSFLISSSSKNKRPYSRLPYGTLQVSVNNTEKFHYLLGLIEGVKKQFSSAILELTPG